MICRKSFLSVQTTRAGSRMGRSSSADQPRGAFRSTRRRADGRADISPNHPSTPRSVPRLWELMLVLKGKSSQVHVRKRGLPAIVSPGKLPGRVPIVTQLDYALRPAQLWLTLSESHFLYQLLQQDVPSKRASGVHFLKPFQSVLMDRSARLDTNLCLILSSS